MKTQTRSVFTVFLFMLALVVLTTCKKKEEDPPPANNEFVIAPTAKFIVDNDWQSMLKNIDSTNYTLTSDNALLSKYTLAKGDLMVSSVGNELLRKIETVTQSGNNVIIETSQATLADFIQQGLLILKDRFRYPKLKALHIIIRGFLWIRSV